MPISTELRNVSVVKNAAMMVGSEGTADRRTRDRLLALLLERGALTASDLACELGISAAGIRRHLDALVAEARSGDRVLIMGARDDTLIDFAQSIVERLQPSS